MNDDYDSDKASIADWVGAIDERLGFDPSEHIDAGYSRIRSTTANACEAPEFELSEVANANPKHFKLPEMQDESAIDALNQAFLNEESMLTPIIVPINQQDEVSSKLDNLQVKNFSLVEMMQKHAAGAGRKTQFIEKGYLHQLNGLEEHTHESRDEPSKDMQAVEESKANN